MKKIIQALCAVLVISTVTATYSAHADVPQSIVVIDNGTNTSLFKDNIVYEVCMVSMLTCPNNKMSMEGTGAANLPKTTNKDFNHGTAMISLILRFNPNVKIIPIRIVGMTAAGNPGLYSLEDVKKALDWVVANRAKYNIAAVSLSQGAIIANCKVPTGMPAQIATLKSFNVPVMVSAGNEGNHTTVSTPACLPDTVSVGATDNPWPGVEPIEYDKTASPYIARYSNGAQGQTDFFINARWNSLTLDGSTKFTVGTSNSTAVMAAWWVLNRKDTFDATYDALMKTTVEAKNEFQTGRYINLS